VSGRSSRTSEKEPGGARRAARPSCRSAAPGTRSARFALVGVVASEADVKQAAAALEAANAKRLAAKAPKAKAAAKPKAARA
jgi:hypothetical protein